MNSRRPFWRFYRKGDMRYIRRLPADDPNKLLNYPDRPDTDVFWHLATIVQDHDEAAENQEDIDSILSKDEMAALFYLCQGRADLFWEKWQQLTGQYPTVHELFRNLYLDAFALGRAYERDLQDGKSIPTSDDQGPDQGAGTQH